MPFFKTENGNAENIKYDDTKSVKEVIDDIKDTAMFIDSFNTDTGTLNTTSESGNSSGNQTASSVTFDNTDTGLEAANVQDAIEEVNGKLENCICGTPIGVSSTYTCPSNGYVCIMNNPNQIGYVSLISANNVEIGTLRPITTMTGDLTTETACFVRKGTKLKTSAAAFASCKFTPLDE